jgi:hypothetical protein
MPGNSRILLTDKKSNPVIRFKVQPDVAARYFEGVMRVRNGGQIIRDIDAGRNIGMHMRRTGNLLRTLRKGS